MPLFSRLSFLGTRQLINCLPKPSSHKLPIHQQQVSRSTATLSCAVSNSGQTSEKTDTDCTPGLGASSVWKPQSLSRQQLLDCLVQNILFDNEHLLAINKPNGFPISVPRATSSWIHTSGSTHCDGNGNPEVTTEAVGGGEWPYRPQETSLSLLDVLSDLQERLNCPPLQLGMPLGRRYSGVVVLTKTEEAKKRLIKFLETTRSQTVFFQTFLCLTVGIPIGDESGKDRVACQLAQIDDLHLTVPATNITRKAQKEGNVMQCDLEYSVCKKNTNLNCSLLQLKPNKDKWDVLEWYCTRRLCAILGDHVYSGRVGSVLGVPTHVNPHIAVPKAQVLPKKLLRQLKLKDTTVDGLPLHLHRHSVELRGIPNKGAEPIIITAPLPDFFSRSSKALQLVKS